MNYINITICFRRNFYGQESFSGLFFAGFTTASVVKPMTEKLLSGVSGAGMIFPIGKPNDAFALYFIRQCYIASVSADQAGIFNVTFEPGSRNNWHVKQLCIQPAFPKRVKQAHAVIKIPRNI